MLKSVRDKRTFGSAQMSACFRSAPRPEKQVLQQVVIIFYFIMLQYLKMSLDLLIDRFLNYILVERGLSRNTVEAYGRDLRLWGEFLQGASKNRPSALLPASPPPCGVQPRTPQSRVCGRLAPGQFLEVPREIGVFRGALNLKELLNQL